MGKNLLIIIPTFNEADNIEHTIENIQQFASEYDYVIINDGSFDLTGEICAREHYHFINLPINVGLAHAIKAGMIYAFEKGYEYAMQFDGDSQHDARYIQPLLTAVESGACDIAIGSRYLQSRPKLTLRILGSRFLSSLIKITSKQRLSDPTSGMRLYNRRIIGWFAKKANINPEPDTIAYLIRCGARVKEIPISVRLRTGGKSMFSATSSIDYMARIAFSLCFVQWFRKREDLL